MRKSEISIINIIADIVIAVIGIMGIVLSIASSYELEVDIMRIILTVLVFCTVSTFLVLLKTRYMILGFIVSTITFFSFYNIPLIQNGASIFANIFTTMLSPHIPSLNIIEAPVLEQPEVYAAMTAFIATIAFVYSFFMALYLTGLRQTLPIITLTLPAFALGLVFVNFQPTALSLVLYSTFVVVMFLTSYVRQTHSTISGIFRLVVVLLVLVSLLATNTIIGENKRFDWEDNLFRKLQEILPLRSGGEQSSDNPYMDFFGIDEIFLNNTTPDFSGETMLRIQSTRAGQQLLRGISYQEYNRYGWKRTPTAATNELPYNGQAIYQSFNERYHSYVLLSPLTQVSALQVNDNTQIRTVRIMAPTSIKFLFTPYYLIDTEEGSFSGLMESYIPVEAYKNVVQENDNTYYLLSAINETGATGTIGTGEYIAAFDNFAKQYYLQVPDWLQGELSEFIDNAGIQRDASPKELVASVANYMRDFGDYTLYPPALPDDADYVSFFLSSSQRGFCMHYATAATLILRTLGVPARYVSGFSTNVINTRIWHNVPDDAAHAWVEVYYEGVGWIPVDVTPPAYTGNPEESYPESSEQSYEPSSQEPSTQEESSLPSLSSEESSSSAPVSSQPEESSLPSVSSVASSSVESSQSSIPIDMRIPWMILLAIVVIAPIITLIFRRRSHKMQRLKDFSSQDTNRAAIAAWVYMKKFAAYNRKPNKNIAFIAQKAFFSQHRLSVKERDYVVDIALKTAKEIDAELGFLKRLVFRYIKALN